MTNQVARPAAPSKDVQRFVGGSHRLLIDGSWVDAVSGATFEVFDPATDGVIAEVAAAAAADVDLAVRAARRALESGPWARMTPAERGRLVWRLGDSIEAHREELAEIDSWDNGKPLGDALKGDLPAAWDMCHYMAGWATKLYGETVDVEPPGASHHYTVREPVGVAGLITPWNFPLMMAAYKLAPALAAGCTVILKPAEQTPLSALRLGQLVQDIGFPPGVVNILPGYGSTAGAALAEHADVDKIAFTGSTEVGKLLVRAAAGNLKRLSLELGGKSPVIVFPDADLERAIPGVTAAMFRNTGQVCVAGSRLYAHASVYDRLVEGVAERAGKIRVGAGLDPATEMGPLVSREQLERVSGYVAAGRSEGAAVILGGGSPRESGGYFLEPTLLAGTTADMSVVREEIFGPVGCVMRFDDDDIERITREANATRYGLAASVWTRDVSLAHKVARRLQAGAVYVNAHVMGDSALPFGGYKESGWGREGGLDGVKAFTELKSISIRL
jgi:phenylacetaldehyde dehydrogenase